MWKTSRPSRPLLVVGLACLGLLLAAAATPPPAYVPPKDERAVWATPVPAPEGYLELFEQTSESKPRGWRDSGYDGSGGNARILCRDGGYGRVELLYGEAGDVLSPAMTQFDFQRYPWFEIKLQKIAPGAHLDVVLQKEYDPKHVVLFKKLAKPGVYRQRLTGRRGFDPSQLSPFSIKLWINGTPGESFVDVDYLQLTSMAAAPPAPAATAPDPSAPYVEIDSLRIFRPVRGGGKEAVYWREDFDGAFPAKPEGWYDNDIFFNANALVHYSRTPSRARMVLGAERNWGKVLSPLFQLDPSAYPAVAIRVSEVAPDTTWRLGIQEMTGAWRHWFLQPRSTHGVGDFVFALHPDLPLGPRDRFRLELLIEHTSPDPPAPPVLEKAGRKPGSSTPPATPSRTDRDAPLGRAPSPEDRGPRLVVGLDLALASDFGALHDVEIETRNLAAFLQARVPAALAWKFFHYEDLLQAFRRGDLDLIATSHRGFLPRARAGGAEPLLTVQTKGRASQRCCAFVLADGPVSAGADLSGLVWGYVDPWVLENAPQWLNLRDRPSQSLKLESALEGLTALHLEDIEVLLGFEYYYDIFLRQRDRYPREMSVLLQSRPVRNLPLFVSREARRARGPVVAALVQALEEAATRPDLRALLLRYGIEGFLAWPPPGEGEREAVR